MAITRYGPSGSEEQVGRDEAGGQKLVDEAGRAQDFGALKSHYSDNCERRDKRQDRKKR
jgi:hypothetical protein